MERPKSPNSIPLQAAVMHAAESNQDFEVISRAGWRSCPVPCTPCHPEATKAR
jgi:hypothetical protein